MDAIKTTTQSNLAQEIFMEDENQCCLCGTDLKFEHKYDYVNLKVREDAHCPACQIKMKTREHILQ